MTRQDIAKYYREKLNFAISRKKHHHDRGNYLRGNQRLLPEEYQVLLENSRNEFQRHSADELQALQWLKADEAYTPNPPLEADMVEFLGRQLQNMTITSDISDGEVVIAPANVPITPASLTLIAQAFLRTTLKSENSGILLHIWTACEIIHTGFRNQHPEL